VLLFSTGKRTDPAPSRYGEDSYSFLDRVDQKFWNRIREELECWFADFPADAAPDLRARFCARDPAQHFAAWWELYLHRFFSRLGMTVEAHPEIAGTTSRPDFRIGYAGGSFLLEAAATFSGSSRRDGIAPERDGSWRPSKRCVLLISSSPSNSKRRDGEACYPRDSCTDREMACKP